MTHESNALRLELRHEIDVLRQRVSALEKACNFTEPPAFVGSVDAYEAMMTRRDAEADELAMLKRDNAQLRALLESLDGGGGLGLDVHRRIRTALGLEGP